ncbi:MULTISPECIES: hypothetical protein [Kitasatospora]|uniref:Uncharacterized protein n=1 Tax=Kitasatospora cystarginea TaxID=58350 RepID=A0ABN3F2M6_9ACTN
MSNSDWTSDRLSQDLQFKVVGEGPPRYTRTTEQSVEFVKAINDRGLVTGYLWVCDADDAAGFERRLVDRNLNSDIFWYGKLHDAKAQGLSPSQALQRLFTDPGNPSDGRLVPDTRAVASSLAELKGLAAEGWTPPKEPVPPLGYRPDPPISDAQLKQAEARSGWLYKVDEGYDPAGRIPPHAVEGAWQVNSRGALMRFWHNPAYGSAPATATPSGEATAVPPIQAGRRPAGRALLDWLEDPRAPRFCRIAGSSGSGRTHLLTWLAAACPPDNPHTGRRVHVALSAEGLTVRSATWLLADRLNVAARTPTDLMEALQDGIPRVLVVTDLDRAGSDLLPDMPERIATELLTPLLQVPWLRLLVESASGTPAAATLTAAAPGWAVLDLDAPRWTDRDRFIAWCARRPDRPQVVADQVYPSPGLARQATRLAALTPTGAVLDPAASPADRASDLAAAWWAALPDELRPAIRSLAASGRPLTAVEWISLPVDGQSFVRKADGWVSPSADGRGCRLEPEQLAQITAGSPPFDHAALVREITTGLRRPDGGWADLAKVEPGWLGLLLRHALYAGCADQFLSDPEFLVHADPVEVTAAFEYTRTTGGPRSELAEAWHLGGPVIAGASDPAVRAAALHAWLAGRNQEAADRFATESGQGWRALWSYRRGDIERVHRTALGYGPFSGLLAVAVGHAVRFIDPGTGSDTAKAGPVRLLDRRIAGLACGEDGGLFMLNRLGAVTAVPAGGDPGMPSRAAEGLPEYIDNGVSAIATLSVDDGPIQAVGDGGGKVTYVRLGGAAFLSPDQPLHNGPVTSLDLAQVDGGVLVVSGGVDGKVWTWMHGRPPMPDPVDAREHPVTAVAVANTPKGLLIASAWADGLIRLRRWGATATMVDLRLGLPARDLTLTPAGLVCLALPEGVLGLTLD